MFHAKRFQRYFASVVCCVIIMLGVLTFLLCFHLHQSSSLEKELVFEEISESRNHSTHLQNIEKQESNYQKTGTDRNAEFTTLSLKTEESMPTHNHIDEGAFLVHKRFEVSKNLQQKSAYTLKPDPNLETFSYTDTIYIDDFERGKSSTPTQKETKSKENDKKVIKIEKSFAEKVNDDSKSELKKKKATKKTTLKMRQNAYLKNNKDNNGNVLDYYETDRAVSNTERNFNEKKQMHLNLDTSFDVPLRNFKYATSSNDGFEDDTEDELTLNGSGSGDFAFADDVDMEQFPYYSNHFVVKHLNPAWNSGDSRSVKSSFIEKRNSSEGKRRVTGNSKRNKIKNKKNPILKELKTPSNNETVLNISEPKKLFLKDEKASSNKTFRKKQSQQKRSKKISTGIQDGAIEKATKWDELKQKNLEDRNSSSETWLETRTRRIVGNVKKSEERSRQLLLCEEAGGGELCRMLFKGHISE